MSKLSAAKPGTYQHVSYNLCHMPSVEYIIVSDVYNTTITINKDGMNMNLGGANGLYNAGESPSIRISTTFSNVNAVIKLK